MVTRSPFSLFSSGFRPFFLAAGIFGAFAVPLWVFLNQGGGAVPVPLSPGLWHAHEMLFGYGAAAMTGFFLTVVPNWTGRAAYRGPMLMGLSALWLAGRVAYGVGGVLPSFFVAALDMSFLIALMAVVAPPLFASQHRRRQFAFVPIIGVLMMGNGLISAELLGLADLGTRGIRLGLDAFILLMTLMGGRVTPSFTSSWLGHEDPAIKVMVRPWLEKVVLGATLGLIFIDQVAPDTVFAGVYLAGLAGLHGARMGGWQTLRTLKNPILWALHLGYGWLVVGFALRAGAILGLPIEVSSADHAITIGAIGGLTLAVMSRAALGHTGRAVVAPKPIVWAYFLVAAAALMRILVPVWPDGSDGLVMASGAVWTSAFILFVWVYGPMLVRARADGREG